MSRKKKQKLRSIYDSWQVSQDAGLSKPQRKIKSKLPVENKNKSDCYYLNFLKNEIARLNSIVGQLREKEYKERQSKPVEQVKIILFMVVMTMYFLISLPYMLGEGQEVFFATSVLLAASLGSICFLLFLEFKQ